MVTSSLPIGPTKETIEGLLDHSLSGPRVGQSTIFLSVPAGHHVADLARGSFLRFLLDARPSLRIAVLSPFASDDRLANELKCAGVICLPLPEFRPGILERVVDSILSEKFLLESKLRAVRLQRDRARLLDGWRGRKLLSAIKAVVCRLPLSRSRWFRLAQAITNLEGYRSLFETYRPVMLVTSTAGFLPLEVPLIYAAKAFGVPQMGVDLGWDNLSSKYHTVLPVDHLAVWNETMRTEAVRYHGFHPDRVAVTGPVSFDVYSQGDTIPTRQEFFRAFGADPARPLVTLASAPAPVYPTTEKVVETLVAAARDSKLGTDVQLLVRVHPRDATESYQGLHDGHRVFVEKPFHRLQCGPGVHYFDAFTPDIGDRRRLAGTLAHSDVIVNFASTTTIEAALFDTPVVNVGYDEVPNLDLPLSISRYYQYEHYQAVVETQAARIATSPGDLIELVRSYLVDPSKDEEARCELVHRCCGVPAGGASERLAGWVLRTLRQTTAWGNES